MQGQQQVNHAQPVNLNEQAHLHAYVYHHPYTAPLLHMCVCVHLFVHFLSVCARVRLMYTLASGSY